MGLLAEHVPVAIDDGNPSHFERAREVAVDELINVY